MDPFPLGGFPVNRVDHIDVAWFSPSVYSLRKISANFAVVAHSALSA
jgi:hypothetical protein